jgi:chromosomal replication initiator protein
VSMMEQLWRDVQGRVERRIGPQNFEIWIKPIRLLGLRGQTVSLEVPNRYYSDWVRDNYQDVLVEELTGLVGHGVQLEFLLEDAGSDPTDSRPSPPPLTADRPAARKSPLPNTLDSAKTFETYVVGSCNKFAHAAALAVADFPGSNYNPLFVFGATGTGKTHLGQAIGNRISSQDRSAGILYTTAEDFVNDMIRALRFKRIDEFRERYRRNADVLVIDDIQFLSGKDRSQEEFFHTFEALKSAGKQIVLTADVLPREIDKLAPRLRTRFEGGLLADIQPPDVETMVAILHAKAEPLGLEVPPDLATWISSRVRGNIRELEGEQPQAITPDKVQKVVARFFNIRVADLTGPRKLKSIVRPRQIAMYLCRHHTELSFPDLGRAFGGRDHSTVQHACKKINGELARDPDLKNHIETLERNLGV